MKMQRGFTLIELMIVTLISTFLVAGFGNLFITVNRTVSLGDALSQNQETGRFAMDYLTRFLRNAGYSQNSNSTTPPVLVIPNANRNPEFEFQCIAGSIEAQACSANNPDSDTILGDRLSIVYVTSSEDESRSCSGRVVGGPIDASKPASGEQTLADVFWVSNEADSLRELRCRTFNTETDLWLDASAVSIISNVESMEFQVGLALTKSDRSAVRYTSVDNVITEAAIERIRSLRIAILTTSTDELNTRRIKTKKEVRNYGVLDAPQTNDALTFEDGNLRNLFITTIELPSAIEGAML